MAETGDGERPEPGAGRQRADVDEGSRGDPKVYRLASDGDVRAEEASQLGEVPAERIEWILSIREEEFRQPLPARIGLRCRQVREEGPRLAPAWRRLPDAIRFDEWFAQEIDRKRPCHR